MTGITTACNMQYLSHKTQLLFWRLLSPSWSFHDATSVFT